MSEVLFVSKPVAPPWNDSSKNLVRDIVGHLQRHTAVLIERRGDRATPFSPGLSENIGVLRYLLWKAEADVWHFFFAPNRKSSAAARFAAAARGVPTVHTVCSLPREGASLDELSFADVTVVLSRFALERFRSAGVAADSIRRIPPSIPPLPEASTADRAALRTKHALPESATIWIYPGDLEHGGGANVALEAFAAYGRRDAVLLMACRDKTRSAGSTRARLVEQARRWGVDARVRWVGETPHIHALLALSDVTVMPNRSPYAKMDYPLVVLEAMCMGRPVIVGRGTPAEELAEEGGALAIEPEAGALANVIERLDGDERARDDLGRRARELVLERFSPANVAADYERLYETLDAR
ncbi:MAG: glycosyltransferase family 4 protein [Deltaproteobacteria bacterium]|jgi:phosphatidylinositol alpha-1,6-mannosyltransferase|nr:glycosyltransferase family 4 protein [Deltaproteobacteria bacterium]